MTHSTSLRVIPSVSRGMTNFKLQMKYPVGFRHGSTFERIIIVVFIVRGTGMPVPYRVIDGYFLFVIWDLECIWHFDFAQCQW